MKRFILAAFLSTIAFAANADDVDDVIDLVRAHWDARNEMDVETQFNLVSKDGAISANSNGAFFSEDEKGTLAEAVENLSNITESNVQVRYPAAVKLSDDVVLSYYYLEGPVAFSDGTRVPNYRTRVTQIWVKEGGDWKSRSWHFSPLHNGGVFTN